MIYKLANYVQNLKLIFIIQIKWKVIHQFPLKNVKRIQFFNHRSNGVKSKYRIEFKKKLFTIVIENKQIKHDYCPKKDLLWNIYIIS